MTWLGGSIDREKWFSHRFRPDQVLEVAVRDDAGHTQGTVLVVVIEQVETTSEGHIVICRYVCASDAHYRWWATEGPGKGLSRRGHYHFCEGQSHTCGVKHKACTLIHCEKFRMLTPEDIHAKTPGGAFSRSCKADTQPIFDEMLKMEAKAKAGDGDLPWLAAIGERSEEDSSETGSSEEKVGEKIANLRKALKAAEEEEKARKAAKKSGGGSGSKKKKTAKGRKKAKEGQADPSSKKVKSKTKKDAKDKGPHAGSAKDTKKDVKKKKKKKKRKHESSSSSSSSDEEEDDLFGQAERGDDRVTTRKGETRDRGPFAGGEMEAFKDDGDSDGSEGSVFREAPTQQTKMTQMKLLEYAQRHPGRLAARLLRKMGRESSLGAVEEEAYRDWYVAELKLSTERLMQPTVHQPMSVELAALDMVMRPGEEKAHLRALWRNVSYRGTDFRAYIHLTGRSEEKHEVPYPALRWDWHTLMSWPWKQDGHINELELCAVVATIKHRGRSSSRFNKRWFLVVDSMVSRGALAKGRSSSHRLNRVLRRGTALLIAQNSYMVPLWTISRWNFSDHASRQFEV
eukprot:Skav212797  [mRNA]  locus=scaffold1633:52507:57435:+ [translate_table: standard]